MKKKSLFLISFFLISVLSFAQYNVSQVKQFYLTKQAAFHLNISDLDDFVITDQYTDQHNGVTHIYLRQRVNGIEIFDANSSIHIDRNGKLLSVNNSFVTGVKQKAAGPVPSIGAQTALMNAGSHISMNVSNALSKADLPLVNNRLVINDQTVSPEPIDINLHYLTVGNELKLVYNVEVFNNETGDWWNVRVDAQNGAIIEKNNWTVSCNFDKGAYSRMYNFSGLTAPKPESILNINKAMKSGTGTYNVIPLPVESPNYGARQLVNGIATGNASPFGWHDTDGVDGADYTITRGNNVFAYDDRANKNRPGFSPDGGASLTFDYSYSHDSSSKANLSAAVTNLFYTNNLVHDIYYNYGFTEQAGNFQVNNYGKGGLQADYVKAEAQDGGGINNANFSAPFDGKNGRMQMYLWSQGSGAKTIYAMVNAPNSIVNTYNAVVATFCPKNHASVTADVVLMEDSNSSPLTYNGCGALQNGSALAGKIALVNRNSACSYVQQVQNAQDNGALAVIIIQSTTGSPVAMSGSGAVTIPAVMISLANGTTLKSKLVADTTVNITLSAYYSDSLDGDIDNGVIVHESGHGVSIRLTGGPANSNCLSNAEQGGEGWSDFFALAFTAHAGDQADDGRGIATYVANQPSNGVGLRSYKYSRDMNIDPLRYSDVKKNPEAHSVGTVWCSVLWDLYWNLTDRYGWNPDLYDGTGGNNKAIQLVMDGLKLQPCSPGFLDSRDAIILADSIDYGGANKGIIWRTFARRGMGYSASEGSSGSATDQKDTTDLPPEFTGVDNHLGIGEGIKLAPNPSTGQVYITLPSTIEKAQIDVVDITGKLLFSEVLHAGGTNRLQLDLGYLNNGIYFISVNSGDRLFQSKLLLSK